MTRLKSLLVDAEKAYAEFLKVHESDESLAVKIASESFLDYIADLKEQIQEAKANNTSALED